VGVFIGGGVGGSLNFIFLYTPQTGTYLLVCTLFGDNPPPPPASLRGGERIVVVLVLNASGDGL